MGIMETPREPMFYPKHEKGSIQIEVDTKQLDVALEKANQLAEKLKEVEQIANSLFGRD